MRHERIEIARETVEISKTGRYTSELGREVSFDPAVRSTFFSAEDLNGLTEDDLMGDRPEVTCEDESVVDTVFRLAREGEDMTKVGVLNFASAHNPGGGFLKGALAQEEAIAYCSNLYVNQISTPFYLKNRGVRSKMYTDHMIYSEVTFFRHSDYRLAERPVTTNVITAAAVNMGQVIVGNEDREEARRVMKHRMGLILDLMIHRGCTTAVLGAFGCGVFQNDPHEVAGNWKALIDQKGHRFQKIIMTVLDKPGFSNYKVFRKYF